MAVRHAIALYPQNESRPDDVQIYTRDQPQKREFKWRREEEAAALAHCRRVYVWPGVRKILAAPLFFQWCQQLLGEPVFRFAVLLA